MGAGSRSNAITMLWAGIIAGILATLVQALLWLAVGEDAWALLLRDARLTAALVLGEAVLPPPVSFDARVMLVATGIHFALSLFYAAVLLPFSKRLSLIPSLLVGAGFGGGLYLVNLHGFTALFPWFVPARGWATLVAHMAFGLTLMTVYRIIGVRCRPGVR